jgi:hypothetical protein
MGDLGESASKKTVVEQDLYQLHCWLAYRLLLSYLSTKTGCNSVVDPLLGKFKALASIFMLQKTKQTIAKMNMPRKKLGKQSYSQWSKQ